ncbi:MAG: ParB/RepB/Spo0J family partition protein [Elusimicrobiota bacterium]
MQKGLGKGIEALITGIQQETRPRGDEVCKIRIEKIKPNRYQSRQSFNSEKLKELSDSIKEKGVIQPLLITPSIVPGEYELIAGERRLRAAKNAGFTEVPAIIKQVSNKEKYQISLIENLQRDDLNPIEEAIAYKGILDEFKITQEELSKIIGKDRSVIANSLRMLNLPESVQQLISSGIISSGHARVIVGIQDTKRQAELIDKIKREKLTVREVEKITQDWRVGAVKTRTKRKRTSEVIAMEQNLQKLLGTKVEINSGRRMKKGKIVIYYYSLDDFERILSCLKGVKR